MHTKLYLPSKLAYMRNSTETSFVIMAKMRYCNVMKIHARRHAAIRRLNQFFSMVNFSPTSPFTISDAKSSRID